MGRGRLSVRVGGERGKGTVINMPGLTIAQLATHSKERMSKGLHI
jgi:hypothetical protein